MWSIQRWDHDFTWSFEFLSKLETVEIWAHTTVALFCHWLIHHPTTYNICKLTCHNVQIHHGQQKCPGQWLTVSTFHRLTGVWVLTTGSDQWNEPGSSATRRKTKGRVFHLKGHWTYIYIYIHMAQWNNIRWLVKADNPAIQKVGRFLY